MLHNRFPAVVSIVGYRRPTRLAADVHGRRQLSRVEVVRAMAAAEAIVGAFAKLQPARQSMTEADYWRDYGSPMQHELSVASTRIILGKAITQSNRCCPVSKNPNHLCQFEWIAGRFKLIVANKAMHPIRF